MNLNGILTIVSASLIEKRELTQQEKEEEEKQQQQHQQQQNNMDVDQQQDKKDKPDQEANEPPAPEVYIFIIFHFLFKLYYCLKLFSISLYVTF